MCFLVMYVCNNVLYPGATQDKNVPEEAHITSGLVTIGFTTLAEISQNLKIRRNSFIRWWTETSNKQIFIHSAEMDGKELNAVVSCIIP